MLFQSGEARQIRIENKSGGNLQFSSELISLITHTCATPESLNIFAQHRVTAMNSMNYVLSPRRRPVASVCGFINNEFAGTGE